MIGGIASHLTRVETVAGDGLAIGESEPGTGVRPPLGLTALHRLGSRQR